MLDMHAGHLNEIFTMPHQRTNFANSLFWAKRCLQQANRMQILKPLAIENIGFAAGNVMHMLSIDQMNFNASSLQDLKQRDPVNTGRFHSDRIDAALLQPVRQRMEIWSKRGKRSHRFGVPIRGDGDKDFRRSNINTASIRSHHGQTPFQLSMLPFLCLCHGSPPLVRQRARRARNGNLSSGIIATKKRCRASPMLLRTGLGSNSLTGSPKQAPMGKRPTLTVADPDFLVHVMDWTGPGSKVPYCYWSGRRTVGDTPWLRRGGRDLKKISRSLRCGSGRGGSFKQPIIGGLNQLFLDAALSRLR